MEGDNQLKQQTSDGGTEWLESLEEHVILVSPISLITQQFLVIYYQQVGLLIAHYPFSVVSLLCVGTEIVHRQGQKEELFYHYR